MARYCTVTEEQMQGIVDVLDEQVTAATTYLAHLLMQGVTAHSEETQQEVDTLNQALQLAKDSLENSVEVVGYRQREKMTYVNPSMMSDWEYRRFTLPVEQMGWYGVRDDIEYDYLIPVTKEQNDD